MHSKKKTTAAVVLFDGRTTAVAVRCVIISLGDTLVDQTGSHRLIPFPPFAVTCYLLLVAAVVDIQRDTLFNTAAGV